jgi:hypothetical protein
MRATGILLGLLAFGAGCWNYRDQLERADGHFHADRYEAAIANLDDLEPELGALDPSERARFAFVNGMSHLRLGHRAAARHWLAAAREMLERGATLPDDDRAILTRTLAEVDWVSGPREGAHSGDAAPSVPSGTEPLDAPPNAQRSAR